MKLGCNSVLFGGCSLGRALELMRLLAFDGVELACLPGMADHVRVDMSSAELAAVKEQLAASGLPALAMEAATNLAKPESRAWFRQALQAAAAIGIPIVTSGSGGPQTDVGLKEAIDNVREVSRMAADLGVAFALKPHVGIAVHNTETALRVVEAVPELSFGINFDASHLFREGETPQDSARRLGKKILHVHIRDNRGREKQVAPPDGQIPGRGWIDLPAVLTSLRSVGYAGAVDLEVIGAAKLPVEQCVAIGGESRGYLFRCLQELGVKPMGTPA